MNILKRDAGCLCWVSDYKRAIANATAARVLNHLKAAAGNEERFSAEDKRALSELIARRFSALNAAALKEQKPRWS